MLLTAEHPDFLATLPPEFRAFRDEHFADWIEADLIAEPAKKPDAPTVLVRRRIPEVDGPRGEQLLYLPGEPTISLFTGAGGFDIGTEAAGFCTVVQHEWDHSACQTLIANRPRYFRHAALIQGDIRETPTSMILGEAGLRVGEPGLLIGGPPCQGFTVANKHAQRGTWDPRNDLVLEYLRVVRESQPKFFLMENVPGFVTFKGKVDGKSYLETFLRAAHDAYYELVYGLLNAVEYGVPQYRCRFFCMGTRRDLVDIEGKLGSLPKPVCFSDPDLKTIRQLEGGLFRHELDALTHAPGVRYFPDRPVLIPPAPSNGQQRSKRFIEFYQQLEANEPDRIVREPAQ